MSLPNELPTAPGRGQASGAPGQPGRRGVAWALAALGAFLAVWAAAVLATRWPVHEWVALALGLVGLGLAVGVFARTAQTGVASTSAAGAPDPSAIEPSSGNAGAPADAGTPSPPPVDTGPAEAESFAYTVSHDLRAPIRVIEGFTRIVREDYGHLLDRVGNDHLDRVLGAAARMNHMIDALLALARLSSQPLSRQPVDLSRLAQHVLDDLCKHAPQRQVQARVMPGLAAQGDPTLLRLVLENLLGNAWKYSARRETAQIEFGQTSHEGRAVYFVSDNGAGFDMRFADRLFGPFQRLHSATEFQGTGVGLASVQRIVRRHGGDIWADAEVDRGATFYFTLG